MRRAINPRKATTALFTALVVGSSAASICASTAVASGGVRIVTQLTTVTAGSSISISAILSRHVGRCTGSLRLGTSATQLSAPVNGVRVTFRWLVPATAPSEPASVTVTCLHVGSATSRFTIVARAIAASAVVTKTGFSTWGGDEGDQYVFIDWGAVIVNNSPDQDAGDVQVTVNVLDSGGKIVATDVEHVQDIPAKATFYLGGETDSSTANAPPASLQITTLVEAPVKAAHLPAVQASNVSFYPQPYETGTDLQGQFSNPFTKTLSELTKISFVAFDGAGNVIGGGRTYSDADVPPGGSLGFSGSIDGTPPAQVASIAVSFDPWFN